MTRGRFLGVIFFSFSEVFLHWVIKYIDKITPKNPPLVTIESPLLLISLAVETLDLLI